MKTDLQVAAAAAFGVAAAVAVAWLLIILLG